jgi:hypothetical protein
VSAAPGKGGGGAVDIFALLVLAALGIARQRS